ncbi:MAG: LPXTG cell wall anchor domain-containing protein [Terrisporobacter sp.]
MKNIIKTTLLSITIMFMFITQVFATTKVPSNVTLTADETGIKFTETDGEFLKIDNMLPGDNYSGYINIDNESNSTFDLYMRIEKDEDNSEFNILDKLILKVSNEYEKIYNGSVNQSEILEKNIYLGALNSGDEEHIKIDLLLDGESTGNEYVNKNGKIKWIFTAIDLESNNLNEEELGGNRPNLNKLPYTGGDGVYVIIIIAIMTIILGLVMIIGKKKDK